MTLQIGQTAPDFEVETTEGKIRFHDWIGDSYAVLFSHPKDFTPVCSTELGYMAKLKPEFDKRNTKIIGLSVDPVGDHKRWSDDIKAITGQVPNYPSCARSIRSSSPRSTRSPPRSTGSRARKSLSRPPSPTRMRRRSTPRAGPPPAPTSATSTSLAAETQGTSSEKAAPGGAFSPVVDVVTKF